MVDQDEASQGPDVAAAVARRIANYWPSKLPRSRVTPRHVEVIRQVARDAGCATVSEAGIVLSYLRRYVDWRLATGRSIEEGLFDAADIDAYVAATWGEAKLKAGSGTSARSVLRRLARPGGLNSNRMARPARTVAPPAAASPAPVVLSPAPLPEPEEWKRSRAEVEREAVVEAMARYRPVTIAADRWDRVASLVADIVKPAVGVSVTEACYLMRLVGYLAGWCDLHGRPLRIDVVMAAATIEEFLTVLVRGKAPSTTVATYASHLHRLRELHGLPLDVPRRELPRKEAEPPYDLAEVRALYQQARCIRSAARRRYVTAAFNLVFGAGVRSYEAGWVRPEDVTVDGGQVVVTVRTPRTDPQMTPDERTARLAGVDVAGDFVRVRDVVVLDRFAFDLAASAREALAHGDEWFLGGSTRNRSHRLASMIQVHHAKGYRIDFSAQRAVRTWRRLWLQELAGIVGGVGALRSLVADQNLPGFIEEAFQQELHDELHRVDDRCISSDPGGEDRATS